MRVFFDREGVYIILRWASADKMRCATGLVIKRASKMMFSERQGLYARARRFGPLYIRTYARKDCIITGPARIIPVD
jgi:hypothetical protein